MTDGRTAWTGVRNFQARNNLKAMRQNDQVLYYHSVVGKIVVGIAKVDTESYPDPTAPDWVCVDLVPVSSLKKPVSLDQIKESKPLVNIALIKQSRLSVMPITPAEFDEILRLALE